MSNIKTIVHVDMPKEGDESIMSPREYYLLHWGLETEIMRDAQGNPVPLTYTVGICQDIKTGHIETFGPKVIKVIGKTKA